MNEGPHRIIPPLLRDQRLFSARLRPSNLHRRGHRAFGGRRRSHCPVVIGSRFEAKCGGGLGEPPTTGTPEPNWFWEAKNREFFSKLADSCDTTCMKPYASETISPRVTAFLRLCELKAAPRYLPFAPLSPDYQRGYCHDNCEAEVAANGGRFVGGWMIWEHHLLPLIEAEFHSVVRYGGKLLDITPRQDDDERILFVPDPSRRAVRMDYRIWDTWSNMKLWFDREFEPAHRILIIDPSAAA